MQTGLGKMAGKGDKIVKTSDHKKFSSGWALAFGKKEKEVDTPPTKEVKYTHIKNKETTGA